MAHLCRVYYPDLELIELGIHELKKHFPESVITCDTQGLLIQALRDWIPQTFRTIWLPHGQSDKGWKKPFFEALQKEDLLLVYGQKMRDVLSSKEISLPQLSVGNFRKRYFETHRVFYDELMDKKFGKQRVILYAPTWEDSEQNGTFWAAIDPLAKKIGEKLLVKPHPNTERKFMVELARVNARLLENFPCVYPLLDRTDAYIGDMSSIGYDFLAYERPLFFLRTQKTDPFSDPSAFLMRCGEQILIEEISSLNLDAKQKVNSQRALFDYAFDPTPDSLAVGQK